MELFAFEEFASRRRKSQTDIEAALRPVATEAADLTKDTDGWDPLLDEVYEQYQLAYYAESGITPAPNPGRGWRQELAKTLAMTTAPRDEATVDRIVVWLATWVLSQATIQASIDDEMDLFLEWVDMGDRSVRPAHHRTNGQVRPIGESFDVDGTPMPYPGWPGAPMDLWMNCRCTLRPVLAEEALVADGFKDYDTEQRKKAHTLPDGSFPIEDCADLKNAIQAIGRANDPAKAKAHIRSRKSTLGCPDVELPESWAYSPWQEFYEWALEQDRKDAEKQGTVETDEPLSEPTHAGLAVFTRDTNRVLMIQRSMDQDDEPDVQGTWEFPGGTIEEGESPQEAAEREFCEETGLAVPDGEITGTFDSEGGVYRLHVLTTPFEAEAFQELNPDLAAAERVNPDDPQRRNPDVSAWFTIEQIKNLGPALRPEVAKTDWSVFDQKEDEMAPDEKQPTPPSETDECLDRDPETGECRDEKPSDSEDSGDKPFAANGPIPFYAVLAPEAIKSGDGRRFLANSLRRRPLPLPLSWQKVSDDGHKGNITVARAEKMARVEGEIRATGFMLASPPEADEVVGLVSEFGRFGISVDADDTTFAINEDEECVDFSDARICSACIVPIPAFAEAWFALGEAPEGFMDGEELSEGGEIVDEAILDDDALVASAVFVDIAPGKTEDGPGWLTNPVDTDRLRDYWVRGPGAAKIAWGTPGDFNRCRVNVAEYVKPQHLNGYCANRHYDALGFWPGEHHAAKTFSELPDEVKEQVLNSDKMAASIGLTAAAVIESPAAWFSVPEPDHAIPITVVGDQVYGHVAEWGVCHIGFDGVCVDPPRSPSNYARFCTGTTHLDNGERIGTGVLSIGGGHAGGRLSARAALAHYDSTSTAVADVKATDGEHGIWVCGRIRPGVTDEMVTALVASDVSGDWRDFGGELDMVAALAVNVGGFKRTPVQVAASGAQVLSLVAAGVVHRPEDEKPTLDAEQVESFADAVAAAIEARAQRRERMEALAAKVKMNELKKVGA